MQFDIQDDDGIRYLLTAESAIQSAINLQMPERLVMPNLESLMGCLMFMPEPKKILILGVAGGSLIHFLRHHLPQAHIKAIDNDAELLASMHTDFLLPQADDLLNYEIADAQEWVKNCADTFDLIIVDLFDEQNMPDWVLGKPFINQLKHLLNDNGCIAWNTLIASEHRFDQFFDDLSLSFEKRIVCLSADEYENTLVYSFNFDTDKTDMEHLIRLAAQFQQRFDLPGHLILNTIFNTNPIGSGFI